MLCMLVACALHNIEAKKEFLNHWKLATKISRAAYALAPQSQKHSYSTDVQVYDSHGLPLSMHTRAY